MSSKWSRIFAAMSALTCGASLAAGPGVHIEDVERFFEIYDAAGGRPGAEQLQRDYLDRGSEGLHHLARMRNVTGARIADALRADFVGELISGHLAYDYFDAMTRGREQEIETALVADQDKTDISDWLNNSTLEKPGDLGYWVGYRITKSYYQRASDKRRALRDILGMTDPKAFLAKSGWYPGIRLQ